MVPRPQLLAFLANCKENPEDDTPRLVMADWLEEHGDPRGEFVRWQVTCEHPERERELAALHGKEWLGALPSKGALWKRGLLELSGHTRNLLSKRMVKLGDIEEAAWVDRLQLYNFTPADFAKLAASPFRSSLTALEIGRGCAVADHIVDPATAGKGTGDWSGLASLPLLPTLSELDLSCQPLGADGAAALAAVPALPRLRDLDLHYTNLGDLGAEALAASRSFTGLKRLVLGHNRMTAKGFAALATWRGVATVECLYLSANYPGAEGVAALVASKHLGQLRDLRLHWNDFPFPSSFGPTRFGPDGAAVLAQAKGMRRLESLTLVGQGIGHEGAETLAESKAFPALNELNLSENAIGDAGAIALARSKRFASLETLDLRYNGIGNAGAKALAESPHLAGLSRLGFRANRDVSEDMMALLQARFGAALDA